MLEDSYDKNKVIECMFDPTTSEILAELENGGKESIHLAKISKISEEEVRERLSYLLEHKFDNSDVVDPSDQRKKYGDVPPFNFEVIWPSHLSTHLGFVELNVVCNAGSSSICIEADVWHPIESVINTV